ncbi:hypothetical protein [uncultured Roseovarius sp.]|uniref:hypothetical protein n=1 Tax=uncultured Roseovarius sp. TaxID=293344 RepID=UPI00262DAF5B|nr:hypothetical protein [uncultured Roseovarius sp.]
MPFDAVAEEVEKEVGLIVDGTSECHVTEIIDHHICDNPVLDETLLTYRNDHHRRAVRKCAIEVPGYKAEIALHLCLYVSHGWRCSLSVQNWEIGQVERGEGFHTFRTKAGRIFVKN